MEEVIRKDNIDIFICGYKPFEPSVSSGMYKILYSKSVDDVDSSGLETHVCNLDYMRLNDTYVSEFAQMKWARDNLPLKDYVGICHYRRYFSFKDNVIDFDGLFSKYDAIVAKPIMYKTNTFRKQYELCHNIEDLDLMYEVVKELYPSYIEKFDILMNSKVVFPCNIFVMKREDFKRYVDFEFDCAYRFLDKIGGTAESIEARVDNNKEKYLKKMYPNSEPWYQKRMIGYLMERLTNVFIVNEFDKLCMCKVLVTEDKYGLRDRVKKKLLELYNKKHGIESGNSLNVSGYDEIKLS